MWLTIATFVGYAVIYTLLLKPLTPQNIVIGGASGAMPPALGWAAVTGHVPGDAWILVLIISSGRRRISGRSRSTGARTTRTPACRCCPTPMARSTTRLHIFLYTVILFAVTMMPFISGMSGVVYLASAMVLGAIVPRLRMKIYREYSDALARKTFRFSILYLSLLFGALLVDHYVRTVIGA